MVSRPTFSFSSLKSDFKNFNKFLLGLVIIITATLVCMILFYFSDKNYTPNDSSEPTITVTEKNLVNSSESDETEEKSSFVDLTETLKNWKSTLGSNVRAGVIVYDLDNDKVAGEFNSNETFSLASVYKLFVVYTGYEKVEKKEWSENEKLLGGKTIGECLDAALRSSDSTCAELLVDKIGESKLDEIVHETYNLRTIFSDYSSTPREVMKMLKIYYEHKDLSAETYAKILDSMLNQPKTESEELCGGTCDWRMGLPSGFSDSVKVYNKVGWSVEEDVWKTYNDAAILSVEDLNRNYLVVVMTENLPVETSKANVSALNSLAKNLEARLRE